MKVSKQESQNLEFSPTFLKIWQYIMIQISSNGLASNTDKLLLIKKQMPIKTGKTDEQRSIHIFNKDDNIHKAKLWNGKSKEQHINA